MPVPLLWYQNVGNPVIYSANSITKSHPLLQIIYAANDRSPACKERGGKVSFVGRTARTVFPMYMTQLTWTSAICIDTQPVDVSRVYHRTSLVFFFDDDQRTDDVFGVHQEP